MTMLIVWSATVSHLAGVWPKKSLFKKIAKNEQTRKQEKTEDHQINNKPFVLNRTDYTYLPITINRTEEQKLQGNIFRYEETFIFKQIPWVLKTPQQFIYTEIC